MKKEQYNEQFIATLQAMWGEGFLSAGGKQAVENMISGLDLNNKTILDLGCGVGGPAMYIAQNYNARVIGVDVTDSLIIQAKKNLSSTTLEDVVDFRVIQPEPPLPFADNSFDIIFSKEAILHVKNKLVLFKELYRILKPHGKLTIADWFHRSPTYSKKMQELLSIDGLTFYLSTFDEYESLLKQTGFKQIKLQEASNQSLAEASKDVNLIKGTYAKEFKQKFGEELWQENLYSWELEEQVFASGELKTALVQAAKP